MPGLEIEAMHLVLIKYPLSFFFTQILIHSDSNYLGIPYSNWPQFFTLLELIWFSRIISLPDI